MFGNNPKRPAVLGDGTELHIKKIFKTIQGEGPFAGMPAIFVRLGGCNLACHFCDTDFENFSLMSIDQIYSSIQEMTNSWRMRMIEGVNISPLVVITGGEPFRQPIELLCQILIDASYNVQIETNGTLYRKLPKEVHIVCSPKAILNSNGEGGYKELRADLLPYLSAIKFLLAQNIPAYRDIAEIGQTQYNIPVFIQPMDQNDPELNQANMKLAISIALQKHCRLSLQLHKVLDIE